MKIENKNDETKFDSFIIRDIRITRDGNIISKTWNQEITKAEEFKVAV